MPITIPIERAFDVRKLGGKPLTYWMRVLAVTLAGMLATSFLAGTGWWRQLTASAYGTMQKLQLRHLETPNETALVIIDDADYWSGPFQGRVPLDRRQLAVLVRAVARHHPRAIALDIDLARSPADAAYELETKELLDTLRQVGADTWIILGKTVRPDPQSGALAVQEDLFDELAGTGRIRTGYTLLPRDPRQIPMKLTVAAPEGSRTLDSIALAIARIRNERRAPAESEEDLPFGDFLPERAFDGVRFSVASLAKEEARARQAMEGNVVIIGGDWSPSCAGCADRVDRHISPHGMMPGAFLHANFVEALIGQYTTATSELVSKIVEVAAAALLAMIFVAGVGRWKYVLLAFCLLAPIPIGVTSLQNFGIYLDAAVLLVLLGSHAALEQILEWREESRPHGARPRRFVRVLTPALLALFIATAITVLWVRHHGETAEASALARSNAIPNTASAILNALEDKVVDGQAAHFPEDARVRGDCAMPPLAAMPLRTVGHSTIIRVPQGTPEGALLDLANAVRVAVDGGARVKVVTVEGEGTADAVRARSEAHAARIGTTFASYFAGTEQVRIPLRGAASAAVPDAQVVVTCR